MLVSARRINTLTRTFFFLLYFHSAAHAQRRVLSFDQDWKFLKGDPAGAEQPAFSDSAWRSLDLPHDWSIEGGYARTNPTGRGGGYVEAGVGWYRKRFMLPEDDGQRRLFIEFDGIMMNSDVWINGWHLGHRPYGYSSFQYELTGHLHFGPHALNIISVRADNSIQPYSRWYTGSGIYRHTRLVKTAPVHVDHWGTFLSTPEVSAARAKWMMHVSVMNQSDANSNLIMETRIFSPAGTLLQTLSTPCSVAAGATAEVTQQGVVDHPSLWGCDKSPLYLAKITLRVGKQAIDEYNTAFGIRQIRFEAATGFWLNGENIKIKGVCLHHDGGAVGAAVPLRIWERRLELLKQAGVNAIRTAHNPPAPEFLDLCDRMGFLVMEETFDTWNARKSSAENGYNLYFSSCWEKDTRDMVLRDRNHPSIILYSVGNEIHDNLNDSSGFRKYKMQQDLIHSLDGTRGVTMALFRPALSHVYENGLADLMDVVGQNYRENELVAAHESKPARKVIGTENQHGLTAWLALRDNPFMAGQFLWTGFDYLGEADWPSLVNGQGLFDRTGTERNVGYQRQSWWSGQPMVYAMRKEQNAGEGAWVSDWTPADMDTYDDARVQVFSNCDEVELFLNDRSHGVRPRPADNASPRSWQLTFEKGTLRVVGRNNGRVVATREWKTAGPPARIELKADRDRIAADWNDICIIRATVVDANGVPCPTADDQLTFTVTGAGRLAGVDNGDLASSESFLGSKRFAWKGTCIALVRATTPGGGISIKATADKLEPATLTIAVK
ncbi:MAG: glycoside hydrolase family 2 TIM barrel-domain containing protein [Bacteroidota bacterium]|nr:glycoside hydrolase family 2 TIM barrel-domain containing protein [Bacteroidota bacterium]MDP4255730.1 glycoside hydrolase family 2 TIM barrel-domain containing protein [Bacteroidota bacterium]MDP4257466.1 glycoside hydrolase family 2 TIM barrel-domain containing protein [Bacteroidota bacterium]